jgi:D-sedoheptulose 7-phosphate isomerase
LKYAIDYVDELRRALAGLDPAAIGTAVSWLKEAREEGRTVFVCGNGGSAAIASHIVVDLLKGASYGRSCRFKIMGLSDNVAAITAYANDVNFDCVFVEQLRNFARQGDILLAISGSGDSRNVLNAVGYAQTIGCRTIGLTRAEGGALKDKADLKLSVPGDHMGRLEDCFTIIGHILSYAFMEGAAG